MLVCMPVKDQPGSSDPSVHGASVPKIFDEIRHDQCVGNTHPLVPCDWVSDQAEGADDDNRGSEYDNPKVQITVVVPADDCRSVLLTKVCETRRNPFRFLRGVNGFCTQIEFLNSRIVRACGGSVCQSGNSNVRKFTMLEWQVHYSFEVVMGVVDLVT